MDEIAELHDTLDRLHAALDDLAVRGLRAVGPRDLAKLTALHDEFRDAGAGHLAERLSQTIEAVRADDSSAAAMLLRAMTASRLFDRMLTLEVAASDLSAYIATTAVICEEHGSATGDDEEHAAP